MPSFVYAYLAIAFFTGTLILLLVSLYGDYLRETMRGALELFAFGIVVVNLIVSVFYIRRQAERDEMREEVILKEQMLRLQEKYFSDMTASYQELRLFRHDINGYLTTIRWLIQGEKYADLNQLMEKMDKRIEGDLSTKCGDVYIGAIVHHFYKICRQEGMGFQMDYDLVQALQMSPDQICSLFYNLLENAVEAARQSKQKWIQLAIHAKDYALMIEIGNSVPAKFSSARFEQGISTKGNPEYHGLGMQNIRSIVESYCGTMETKYNHHQLFITIVLPGAI